jgi:hypothetical protein
MSAYRTYGYFWGGAVREKGGVVNKKGSVVRNAPPSLSTTATAPLMQRHATNRYGADTASQPPTDPHAARGRRC